jgi:hypothetical protein
VSSVNMPRLRTDRIAVRRLNPEIVTEVVFQSFSRSDGGITGSLLFQCVRCEILYKVAHSYDFRDW